MSFTIGKEISVARVQRAERSARDLCARREKNFFFFVQRIVISARIVNWRNNARRPRHKTSLHFNVRPENGSGAGRARLAATRSQFWTLRN